LKYALNILIVLSLLLVFGCEKKKETSNAAKLSVDFSWKDMKPCGWGNPEIDIGGIPKKTKFLQIEIKDIAYKHDSSSLKIPYSGESHIDKGIYKELKIPCPGLLGGEYELTIKAIDENEASIAIGSKKKNYPEGK